MNKNGRKIYHKRQVKIPTVAGLEASALYYLSRYAASEASLRRMLENRLRRAAFRHPAFAEDKEAQANLHTAIDAIVAKHKKIGAINDAAYAAMKISSARRAGRSARMIKQKLGQRGIAAATIDKALLESAGDMDSADAETKAAFALAKKRKLGPFGKKDNDPAKRQKEFATMARAGFSASTIRQVFGADAEDLPDWE